MANVKITELPVILSGSVVANTDVLPIVSVGTDTTSKITVDSVKSVITSGSLAQGSQTRAFSVNSHAEGQQTVAGGTLETYAVSGYSAGVGVTVTGNFTSSLTPGTVVFSTFLGTSVAISGSNAAGGNTFITSSTLGAPSITGNLYNSNFFGTTAGPFAHSEGYITQAIGTGSHAEGFGTLASGSYSHTEGTNTRALSVNSHAEGEGTLVNTLTSYGGIFGAAHAEGYRSTAAGAASHAEGWQSTAVGGSSHAEGISAIAVGQGSHAEGLASISIGAWSHAEGQDAIASGSNSHAEGIQTISIGAWTHAEGQLTTAVGTYSHAEGERTIAVGIGSHAEGISTTAVGLGSHAEGYNTVAVGGYSHAEGEGTIASGSFQLAIGTFNTRGNTVSRFVVGGGVGTPDANRKDIFRVDLNAYPSVMIPNNLYPVELPNSPVTGSMFVDAVNKKLYIFTGNGSTAPGWATASLG